MLTDSQWEEPRVSHSKPGLAAEQFELVRCRIGHWAAGEVDDGAHFNRAGIHMMNCEARVHWRVCAEITVAFSVLCEGYSSLERSQEALRDTDSGYWYWEHNVSR